MGGIGLRCEGCGGGEAEDRSQTLAARFERVAHGLVESRGAGRGDRRQAAQRRFRLLDGKILASVQLEKHSEGAYLGMLAVNPVLQNQGIGKRLMAEAEAIAKRQWAAQKMLMTVINLRYDVIAFYQRHGYARTGRTVPFPTSEKYGIQKVPGLMLEYLEKRIDPLSNC